MKCPECGSIALYSDEKTRNRTIAECTEGLCGLRYIHLNKKVVVIERVPWIHWEEPEEEENCIMDEILDAVYESIGTTGIKRSWIAKHIRPVLDKYEITKTDNIRYYICPECHSEMEVDEEYMQKHYELTEPRDIVYWCENCEEVYTGGVKS